MVDGELVNSCLVPAFQVDGRSVVTIEGLGTEEDPDPVQEAFLAEGGVQCGFCIPGIVMAAHALLRRSPSPARVEIRESLAGNLCRCTGYERIVTAVERAAGRAPRAGMPVAPRAPARSLDDVLALLDRRGGQVTPVAGATDLLADLKLGGAPPADVVDVLGVPELAELRRANRTLEIGAAVTVTRLLEDPDVGQDAPALRQAASVFGSLAIRNRATLGGNVMSASPAADLTPVLMALDARAVLASTRGRREIPIADLYAGYRVTVREPDEILASVRIPVDSPVTHQAFYKVGTRRAQSIAKVSLAARTKLTPGGTLAEVRLAAGSVAPTTVLLADTARWLEGRRLTAELAREAGKVAMDEVRPIDDVRSTAAYRKVIMGRLISRFLKDELARLGRRT
jgi:carbon-monoxide dehydrogenase small subunit/xanthine dehydrogenase small subunit